MKTINTVRGGVMGLVVWLMMCACTTRLQAQAPVITAFSPASGSVGTLVTVSGINLNSPISFTIGGVNAIVVSNTGSSLVGMVMPGAATGGVVVTTAGGTANGSGNFSVMPTSFPSVQQGGKLVGTGAVGDAYQGTSVALSSDGNTAIIGGSFDSSAIGAAWVFTRSGGVWTQQGAKLVGTDYMFSPIGQGCSVALSADGNTAIVGGSSDNYSIGAAWVYTRSGGVWTQQGAKLVGTGYIGANSIDQGTSVALSSDGNTAMVGGRSDSGGRGAVWVYTRSGGVWTQQGTKLVGTGADGLAYQGISVALSSDGNTAIVGGFGDNSDAGAAWVFTRSGGVWTQQGAKLVGTGAVGSAFQGTSIALSADGNTAIVGGNSRNVAPYPGAAWVYARVGGLWTQQGAKLVGTGVVGGGARQGSGVSISADGNTAIVGGQSDSGGAGAIWVYTRSGGVWTQQGAKLVGTGAVGLAYQGTSVALSSDGNTAIVGGMWDNNKQGAAWVFASSSSFFPVKLLSFTGEKQGTNNLLHWSTATEQNNKGFEVQRSANGESFTKIAFVNSQAVNGNSTGTLMYNFSDKNPLSGNNFYRLKQVDNDGKETLSNVVLVKGETGDESMTVALFPNPGSSWFTLIVNSSNTQPVTIRVMDAVGKIAYEAKGNIAQAFRFGEKFANGEYIVEVRQGNEVKTVKAVKMK